MKVITKILYALLFIGSCALTAQEKMEVEGAIIIDNSETETPATGTIRWNPSTQDFEGYTGTRWKSLTQGNTWGDGSLIHETEKLVASDAAVSDLFGFSVSISGDYAIVGAWRNDDGGTDSGSAYIYHRTGTSWTQQAKLVASDAAAGDWFGWSVSLSGAYAIVGALNDDHSATDSGSAYIYHRTGTSWTQQAKLVASDATTFDGFGYSVSISGDYAIVGAYGVDDANFGASSGSAYIYHRTGNNWTQQTKLVASDAAASDIFGYSVSLSGDYAIVGAPQNDDGVTNSGSAYIYHRTGNNWTQQVKLVALDAAVDDFFGSSVSISGAYAIVGVYNDDDGGTNSGSAYIYHRTGTSWTQQAKLMASDTAADDFFGYSVSLSGAYAIVGAYADDDGGSASGSAYIYHRTGKNWTQQTKLVTSDAAANDTFGFSVSISGAYVIVSAHADDDGGSASGSAYIFSSN